MPLSKLTAASLVDLGYHVNFESSFIDQSYDGFSTTCCFTGRRNLRRNLMGSSRPLSAGGKAAARAHGLAKLQQKTLPPGQSRTSQDGKATYFGDQYLAVFYYEEGVIYSVDVTPDA